MTASGRIRSFVTVGAFRSWRPAMLELNGRVRPKADMTRPVGTWALLVGCLNLMLNYLFARGSRIVKVLPSSTPALAAFTVPP